MVVAGIKADTPTAPWFMVLTGALAICAWILPGVSGSFILLLLHKYDYVWESFTLSNGLGMVHNAVHVIVPFGIGAVVGLALFSRVLSWVMQQWPRRTTMAMDGLLFVSLWAIFPYQHAVYEVVASGKEKMVSTRPYIPPVSVLLSPRGLLTIGLALAGIAIVVALDYMARKKRDAGLAETGPCEPKPVPAIDPEGNQAG